MRGLKGRDDRNDLQIQMLERMVSRLVNLNLCPLSSKIATGNLPNIKEISPKFSTSDAQRREYPYCDSLQLDFVHFLASRSLVLPAERDVCNLKGMVKWPFLRIKNHSDPLEPLGRCSQKMYKVEYNIKTQEQTVMDHLSEKSQAFVKWGANNLSPVVREYVKSRLKPRFDGMISMSRDQSVFTAALRKGIREYRMYKRGEGPSNPFKSAFSRERVSV